MLKFRVRPPPPQNFINSNAIANGIRLVDQHYANGLPGLQNDEDGPSFPKDIDHWGKFKNHFSNIQFGRCGYCEMAVIGAQRGDVEHYRPKGRVRVLDPDNQGEERDDLSNITGRKHIKEFGTGYWWLAFDWNNYLLSCMICNQVWKIDYFPVDTGSQPRQRPAQGNQETALLLNPFDDDPSQHLGFDADGTIRAKTKRGLATIETVGLWRPSLVLKRRPVLQNLDRLIDEMNGASAAIIRSHARSILASGAEDWPIFPGMVRTYFTDETGLSWSELQSIARP